MTQKEKLETKDKIVAVASELFSRFGFEGTSVRDIASQSGVNVASINYHFGSKHNLYWATVDEKHEWLDQGLARIAEENDDIADVIVKGYQLLMTDPSAIRTALKIMLTDGVPEPEGEIREKMMSHIGPPGSTHLTEVLQKCLPENTSESTLQWGVKALFAGLIHWAMLRSSCKFEMMKEKQPNMLGSEKGIEDILRHHSWAILEYMKANPTMKINA